LNIEDYKLWYVHDEGHWYTSKVKQYKPSAIQEFAKGLNIIDSIINADNNSDLYNDYYKFRPEEPIMLFEKELTITINNYSVLFICLHFLKRNLINLNHLEIINPNKFKLYRDIQKEFIEGKNYAFFVNKYELNYLKRELFIYYRNFRSWFGKYGFYGEYENGTTYITEIGLEFKNNYQDIEICSALFLNQIKKYQIWNPTVESKYKDYKVRPYYLLLEILIRLPQSYFTKIEHALFITKIKSHNEKEIHDQIKLISEFREFEPEEQQKYIDDINVLDKKLYRKRKRTNYERLADSASKEISSYGYGALIDRGEGRFKGTFLLTDKKKAESELNLFTSFTRYIKFDKKFDWIAHLGSKEGINLEQIIEIYIENGMSIDNIKDELKNLGTELAEVIQDKIYEKEIETYYVKNITEINPNLEVIKTPVHGRQFSTHIGPIDILCIDKVTKEYVVCELKRGQTSDETVGQILRYMGWVFLHLEDSKRNVRGILIGSSFDEKIDYSLMGIQNDDIYKLIDRYEHPFSAENKPPIFKN
jgi:hypothetical protein